MIKRIFDLVASLLLLVVLSPLFLFAAVWVATDSRGGVFFVQRRVGWKNREFGIIKFRTMKMNANTNGLLTIGNRDARITRAGRFLRRYKLDELPQLVNVLLGQMSLVGPRPEVRRYVDLYDRNQLRVLSVRPGITDYASVAYTDENELLAAAADPESEYVRRILPEKLNLGLRYIEEQSLRTDVKILWLTVRKILFRK